MAVAGSRVTDDEEEIFDEIEKECEPCKSEHAVTTANGICRECEEYMCNKCFRHHLKAKQCRNHILVDTQSVFFIPAHKSAENVEKCKRHANAEINFYCRKHDIVGCGECMIPDHCGCNPENLKVFAKGFEVTEDFKCLGKKLEGLVVSNNENERKVHENQKANKVMYERALKDIRNFRKDVNNYLDKVEKCVKSEAKDIKNSNASLLTKLEQECQRLSSKIVEMEQKLNTELYSDRTLFIQTINYKPLVFYIEQRVSRIQIENCMKEFKFVPDKQIQNLISSVRSFGQLATTFGARKTSVEGMTLSKKEQYEPVNAGEMPVTKSRDEEKNDLKSPQTIAVGTRVRFAGTECGIAAFKYHMGKPGTVTTVYPGRGLVYVKWDATGSIRGHPSSTVKLL